MTKDKDKTIFSFKVNRIYPGQIKSTTPFEIQVSNLTIDEYIDKNIIVRVFSEMPTVEKEVSVVDILHFNEYGTKKPLTRDDFASKYGP